MAFLEEAPLLAIWFGVGVERLKVGVRGGECVVVVVVFVVGVVG